MGNMQAIKSTGTLSSNKLKEPDYMIGNQFPNLSNGHKSALNGVKRRQQIQILYCINNHQPRKVDK